VAQRANEPKGYFTLCTRKQKPPGTVAPKSKEPKQIKKNNLPVDLAVQSGGRGERKGRLVGNNGIIRVATGVDKCNKTGVGSMQEAHGGADSTRKAHLTRWE